MQSIYSSSLQDWQEPRSSKFWIFKRPIFYVSSFVFLCPEVGGKHHRIMFADGAAFDVDEDEENTLIALSNLLVSVRKLAIV